MTVQLSLNCHNSDALVQLWHLFVSLFTWNAPVSTLTLDVVLLAFAWFDYNYYLNHAHSVWPILGHQTSACRLITGLQACKNQIKTNYMYIRNNSLAFQ